jgi:DNA-binding PadR family transcriptional regulator
MKTSDFEISNLTRNCNEMLILSTLFREKKHGYQLALEIEERSSGYFKFNHGTLYPILHKLEKEGKIKGAWKQEGPKRKRKYYSLTVKGRKYAIDQLAEWREFFRRLDEIIGEVGK